MNSIINPWVFYWIGIVDSVRTLLIVILTVLMIGGAIMFMCTMSDADDRGFKDKDVAEEVKLCIKLQLQLLLSRFWFVWSLLKIPAIRCSPLICLRRITSTTPLSMSLT